MAFQRVKPRQGTAALFTSTNPVLQSGEVGYETDTGKRKIGDGVTAWNALPYEGADAGVTQSDVDNSIATALGGLDADAVGAEPAGTMTAHLAADDPHPQYAHMLGGAAGARIWGGTDFPTEADGLRAGDYFFREPS